MALTSTRSAPSHAVDGYMKGIGRIPLLDRDGELRLALQIRAGREAEDRLAAAGLDKTTNQEDVSDRKLVALGQQAKERFVEANLRLVVSIAKRFQTRGVDLLDLIQEGNIGLMEAVDRFDPTKGFRFSTYATWWIRRNVMQAISGMSRTIKLPYNAITAINKIRSARDHLSNEFGREPTVVEVSEYSGLQVDRIVELQLINQPTVSLDLLLDGVVGDDVWLSESLASGEANTPVEDMSRSVLVAEVIRAIASLPERERLVIQLRFGIGGEEGLSNRAVGARMGLSHEWVRRIEWVALRRLRSQIQKPIDLSSDTEPR